MKRLLFFGIVVGTFLLILISSEVSAQSACTDDQVIFKISGINNAHAEFWSEINYSGSGTKVCFDDFFLGTFNGADPRSQTETNKVIGLSSLTNAHVEAPNMTDYSNNVFYGDLRCEVKSWFSLCRSLTSGNNTGTRLISLADYTNSHAQRNELAEGSDHSGYDLQLCCVSASTQSRPGNCGDGNITASETCDIGQDEQGGTSDDVLGGASCPSGTAGEVYCNNNCELLSDCALITEEGAFCRDYAFVSGGGGIYEHKILINGILTEPTSCGNYNEIEEGDVPAGVETLESYKSQMCGDCGRFIGRSTLCQGASNPDDCVNPHCVWDSNSCRLGYETLDGTSCIVEEVPGSDEGCSAGQLFRTIRMTDSCDLNCPPGSAGCEKQIPCPRTVQLPFFTFTNLIIVVLVVIIVYVYLALKNKTLKKTLKKKK